MKPENVVNYAQVQEISRILNLQIDGVRRALGTSAAGLACVLGSLALTSFAQIGLYLFGFCLFIGPIIYIAMRREPYVPDQVLTLVSRYQPNNGASVKEFEAFQEGFRKSERREQVLRWCSREQDYLRAEELGDSGRLAFLSRDLKSEKSEKPKNSEKLDQ